MAISTGGITEEWGEPKQVLQRLIRLVHEFAPRQEDAYRVDIASRSWHNFREPEFHGVQPDMVGRKQRRFIVWHSVPQGLETDAQAQRWLASVLPETPASVESTYRRSPAPTPQSNWPKRLRL